MEEKVKVYFTRDLSSDGLEKVYRRVNAPINGKVAVKLHTGERHGPNIIPRSWVKKLFEDELKGATIVETNTLYHGDRYTTEDHLETVKINGWDFANVDILDSEGTIKLPIIDGKWMKEMSVGLHTTNYDSLVVLTHFKGHVKGGFGGSNKNLGIGMADGRVGKAIIHSSFKSSDPYDIERDELMERISESTKATIDYFKDHICYVNVMRNMSVSCDCEGVGAKPVVTPNVGILSSLDILAIDKASVDLIYAMKDEYNHDLVERIETRRGLRQLSYMKELKMGNDNYILIDIDNNDKEISLAEAVKDVKPFVDDGCGRYDN